MPCVGSLIDKSNIKKNLRIINVLSPLNVIVTNKTNFPFRGNCQFECIVYKVEVHSRGSKDNHVCRNDKKCIGTFYAGTFQKTILQL